MIPVDGRKSGVLLHITSLPSPWGVGDMGSQSYRFIDLLKECNQSVWQILPLNPTEEIYGFSPYSSVSAFAGNVMLISPMAMVEEGFLTEGDLPTSFNGITANFRDAINIRQDLLYKGYCKFTPDDDFRRFGEENSWWLEDYALYKALKSHYKLPWYEWPDELKSRQPQAIEIARKKFANEIMAEKFAQYIFYRQWDRLHLYAKSKGISVFGDMPLYLAHDSADVWANREMFCLDERGMPTHVAGVPPDYFSVTGQYWGNPLYNWDVMEKHGFEWWIRRLAHAFRLYDMVRIDHFRGLVAYWAIPSQESTAVNGRWVKGPANKLFNAIINRLGNVAIVAEDLGQITQDVRQLMDAFHIPGMRVILFGLDNPKQNLHAPFYYTENCIAYTGTQDNNTALGWFLEEVSSAAVKNLKLFLGRKTEANCVSRDMVRLVELSVAKLVIIPFQDILGLGPEARMNRPASKDGNWQWRMHEDMMRAPVLKWFKGITMFADRG